MTFDWGRPRPSYQGSMNKLGWSGRQDQTRLPSLSYGFASQQNAIAPSQFQMFDACCLSLQLGRARWRRRRRTESAVVSTVACWCSRWASRTRRWKRSSSGWNIMKTCRSRPSSNRIQGTANSHRPTTRETAGRRQQPLRPPLSGWTLPTWSWPSPPWLQLGRRSEASRSTASSASPDGSRRRRNWPRPIPRLPAPSWNNSRPNWT